MRSGTAIVRHFVLRTGLIITLMLFCGCAGSPKNPRDGAVVIVIPGAGGAGGLGGLMPGLRDGLPVDSKIEVFHWGAPPPLFLLNLQNRAIHDDAERKLANFIKQRAATHPTDVMLVAHSAGCGVALGGLRQLEHPAVRHTILLAPSVSPGYDLSASLRGMSGTMHVFHSTRDNFWLSWRTGTFGTYDNVKTKAAGNLGFIDPPAGVVQHPYQEQWRDSGNNGGHFDLLSRRFIQSVVAPMMDLP